MTQYGGRTPPRPAAPDLLRQAADLITRALCQLNVQEKSCSCCGTRRFVNYEEAKIAERLTKMPDALRESASRIDNNVTRSMNRQGDAR